MNNSSDVSPQSSDDISRPLGPYVFDGQIIYPRTKSEAKALGLKFYTSATRCRSRNHGAVRLVSTNKCKQCMEYQKSLESKWRKELSETMLERAKRAVLREQTREAKRLEAEASKAQQKAEREQQAIDAKRAKAAAKRAAKKAEQAATTKGGGLPAPTPAAPWESAVEARLEPSGADDVAPWD